MDSGGPGSQRAEYRVPWWPCLVLTVVALPLQAYMLYLQVRNAVSALELLYPGTGWPFDTEVRFWAVVATWGFALLLVLVLDVYLALLAYRYSVCVDADGLSVRHWHGRTRYAGWGEVIEARLSPRGGLVALITPQASMRISGWLSTRDGRRLASQAVRNAHLQKASERKWYALYEVYRRA